MTEALLLLVVFVLVFAYGWFLRGKHIPRRRESMNEYQRKFLLWYVKREIKRFNKKNLIDGHKGQIGYLNAKNPHSMSSDRWLEHKKNVERLTQLMKWEYSLSTVGHFGEDFTHDKQSVKNYSSNYMEPTKQNYADWATAALDATPFRWNNDSSRNDYTKMWQKMVDGKMRWMTDPDYQKMRASVGLPPRKHDLNQAITTPEQDELDRKHLEANGTTSK